MFVFLNWLVWKLQVSLKTKPINGQTKKQENKTQGKELPGKPCKKEDTNRQKKKTKLGKQANKKQAPKVKSFEVGKDKT